MRKLLLLCLFVTCATSLPVLNIDDEWSIFKVRFNRSYVSNTEEAVRYNIFAENVRKVHEHNMAADKGLYSFWLGINHFADMTDKEFEYGMTGLDINAEPLKFRKSNDQYLEQINSNNGNVELSNSKGGYDETSNLSTLPREMDWRNKKCVTPVKYQGYCGSCYAFSTTGALESHHCLKTGRLISLSEQNIIDCTTNRRYLNKGCKGGLMDHGFRYVIDNGGIDTEASYPYKQKVGRCKFSRVNVGATEVAYKDILPRGDENELKKAVGTRGPVSVGVDAHGFFFKLYSHGVYDSFLCSTHKLNHGMLVVGYGTTQSGKDYWIIKNSWSARWGIKGYMKMIRNHDNRCGIASLASYPIV